MATLSGSEGYGAIVPTGTFSKATNSVSSVNPMLSITGSGYLEQLGLFLYGSYNYAKMSGIKIEVDGVVIESNKTISSTVPAVGISACMYGSGATVSPATWPGIRFRTSLKVWITSSVPPSTEVFMAGRVF